MPTKQELEEIDRIVDSVLDDDKKAEELKNALHHVAKEKPSDTEVVEETEEGEDLWDDVPV
jgi:TATA-binding protein-associated factor Taf7